MPLTFDQDGIGFAYPENWALEQEETASGWTVSVQSPDTAFFLVNFDGDMPEAEAMAKAALEAMQAEYPDLESDECFEDLAGQPTFGHDIQFFSLDLTNSCSIRSLYAGRGTVLLLWQWNDLEMEKYEPILKAMLASLKIEGD